MANPQEGEMDREQAPHFVDDLRRPTNDSFGVHYCVGYFKTILPNYASIVHEQQNNNRQIRRGG